MRLRVVIVWFALLVTGLHSSPTVQNHAIADAPAGKKVPPRLTVVAGRLAKDAFAGGQLSEPFGVAGDSAGNLVIVELGGGRVHRLAKDGTFSTIAGAAAKGDDGDGGSAAKARFHSMHNVAIAPNDDIYVSDTLNHKIRKIDAKTGFVSTFVGTGKKGFSGDGGPATKADCGGLYCVSFEPGGKRMFLADLDNRRIRVVTMADGTITTFAGNGEKGVPKDGDPAAKSPLVDPRAVACDSQGNVYILERSGHALRRVDAAGKIHTVAGTGRAGPPQDDVPARDATLNGPKHLCVDRQDNVIIADAENHVIVKYLPSTGRVVWIAGTGKPGQGRLGDSPRQTELSRPHGVYVDPKGTLYIIDTYHERVLKWAE